MSSRMGSGGGLGCLALLVAAALGEVEALEAIQKSPRVLFQESPAEDQGRSLIDNEILVDMQAFYDTVPTFIHTCRLGGGVTDEDFTKYEFHKYNMVTIEKGEALFELDGATRRGGYAEEKMVDTCKRFKEQFGMSKRCYIYYNSLLDWPYYKLSEDYTALIASNDSIKTWFLRGDLTFPSAGNLRIFDFRIEQVQQLWLTSIKSVLNDPPNQGYIDGVFVDRGYTSKKEASRTRPSSDSLLASEYYDAYEAGHENVIAQIPTDVIINPGPWYANEQRSLGAKMFTERFQTAAIVHLERVCASRKSVLKAHKAVLGGKEIQFHGGNQRYCKKETSRAKANPCQTHMRQYMATYLFALEANVKTYFNCHQFWYLDEDEAEGRHEMLRFAEYDFPLGVPGKRVLRRNTSREVPLTHFYAQRGMYRPFRDRETGRLQAVAVWAPRMAHKTVCFANHIDCAERNTDASKGKLCMKNDPNVCPKALAAFEE